MQKDGLNIHAADFAPDSGEREVEEVARPRLPCNFSEEGDEHEMHDDYHEYQRNDEEEVAWQHHLSNCIDDQLMADVAHAAIEEAKARAKEVGADAPEFIKLKRKCKGGASK